MPLPGNCQHSVDSLVVNGSPSLMARLHMLQRLISHICKLGVRMSRMPLPNMRLHCFKLIDSDYKYASCEYICVVFFLLFIIFLHVYSL